MICSFFGMRSVSNLYTRPVKSSGLHGTEYVTIFGLTAIPFHHLTGAIKIYRMGTHTDN